MLDGDQDSHISIAGVSIRYGQRTALEGVTLEFDAGSVAAIVGENGSGKSTLLRAMAGIERPRRGSVHIGPWASTDVRARGMIGYLPQRTAVLDGLTVTSQLQATAAVQGIKDSGPRVHAAIDRWQLAAVAQQRVDQLSPGMQRRIGLAMATLAEPAVLLLDEAQSGLDAGGVAMLNNWLAEIRGRCTVVHATHDPIAATSLSDQLVVLHRGRVVRTVSSLGSASRWHILIQAAGRGPPDHLQGELEPCEDGVPGWIATPAPDREIADVIADLVTAGVRIEQVVALADAQEVALRRLMGGGQ